MDSHYGTYTRKRKRRRGPQRPAIQADLVLESRLKGDVGLLSEDLFDDLFPALASTPGSAQLQHSDSRICHIAITPKTLSAIRPDSLPWTLLAVKRSNPSNAGKPSSTSKLHFSASSTALQSFAQNLLKSNPNAARLPTSSFEIHILDAVPISLDTIVVSLDDEILTKLDQANQKFRHGQPIGNPMIQSPTERQRSRSRSASSSAHVIQPHWEEAVRASIKTNRIIHTGDPLPLPLPSHPITHSTPPPALVELCEPVSQGVVQPSTRIVIVPKSGSHSKRFVHVTKQQSIPLPTGLVHEEDEDTSNEQFYSATEDTSQSPKSAKTLAEPEYGTDTEVSNDEDGDLSEGESDTVGLSLPSLPPASSMSSFGSATPKGFNFMSNGIASPGSVVSGMSMSTVLGGASKGKLFTAQGLVKAIPDHLLFPRPSVDEDEEARAFVDTALLAKVGCFSGDWIRLESAPEESLSTLGSWGLGAFEPSGDELHAWRAVRIYAMPGQSTQRPRYAINKSGNNRYSQHSIFMDRTPPKAFLSPILLANLGNPANVRIAALMPSENRRGSRMASLNGRLAPPAVPPVAREASLRKLSTSVSHERIYDTSLRWALEKYLKKKQRLLKNGDLIAIAIDEGLSRALAQANAGEEDLAQKEFHSTVDQGVPTQEDSSGKIVAWFEVGNVVVDDEARDTPWGPLAVVRPDVTRIAQVGDALGKLPASMKSTWQYYLGVRKMPPIAGSTSFEPDQISSKPTDYVSATRRRLRELISAATSPQAIHLSLPPVAVLLVSTQRLIGKATVATEACADLGLHTFAIDAFDILSEGGAGGGDVKTAGFLETRAERGLLSGKEYTALLIKHIEMLTADRMVSSVRDLISKSRIFIATTTKVDKIPEGMRSLFTHELELSAPDEGERQGLLRSMVQSLTHPVSNDVDLSSVALKTAALVAGDLADVAARATVARQERLEKLAEASNRAASPDTPLASIRDIQVAGGDGSRCIIKSDFDLAVDAARKNFADAIGAPKIPNVGWNDVGGLTNVKDAVMETIQLPLERPELFAQGMKKRSGILFYGPPGTGKTLLAKAIATEFSLNFFSVKGPELLNMYIGESEANVRRVFQRARDARPCVVFFDELDSVAPKRGNQGDSGGVMDRIVSQLLAELDGMSDGSEGVFVIGATNRPDLLDQALLRPGRFDKMLYLGVSDTHQKQQTILEALTRKFALDPTLSLSDVAETLPFTYTGADLYALCSDAMLKAITRRSNSVDAKIRVINAQRKAQSRDDGIEEGQISVAYFFDHLAEPEDTEVSVSAKDFDLARRELVPSVSVKELEHYEKVRSVFETVENSKEKANGTSRTNGHEISSDDDFIIRTSNLKIGDDAQQDHAHSAIKITGKWNGNTVKGKGKSKSEELDFGFGNAVEGDDNLYGE